MKSLEEIKDEVAKECYQNVLPVEWQDLTIEKQLDLFPIVAKRYAAAQTEQMKKDIEQLRNHLELLNLHIDGYWNYKKDKNIKCVTDTQKLCKELLTKTQHYEQ